MPRKRLKLDSPRYSVNLLALLLLLLLALIIAPLFEGRAFGRILFYWATEFIASERIAFAEPRFVGLGASERQVTAFSQMVYFSFVTMSTLGYGDAAPVTPLLQTLAWMQAVAGQFYIAVLVARLVAEVRIPDDRPRSSPARDVAAGSGDN